METLYIHISKYHTPVLCYSLIFYQEGLKLGYFHFFLEPTLMLRWENSSLISIFMACLKGLGGLHGVDCICTLLDYRQELSDLAVKTSCKKGSNNIDYVLIHLIFLFQHGNTHRSRNWGKVFSCILNTSCLTSFLSMDCKVIFEKQLQSREAWLRIHNVEI